jgi:hypothetical protein
VICEAMCGGGYDIGQLQERPVHLLAFFRLRGRVETEALQRAGGSFQVAL